MNYTIKSLIAFILLSAFISCTSLIGTDDFYPDSDVEIFIGSTTKMFENYSGKMYADPFRIDDLSRSNNVLNIDVTYSGGEGGCPPHLFVVNWDGIIHTGQNDSPLVKLGLAHFIPTTYNCEALVEERLKIDLTELLNEQLQDRLSFIVTNLIDSTQVTLDP